MVTFGEKLVERTEKALVESIALEHCRQMPMTIDDCWRKIQPLGFDNKVDRGFVADAYKRLEREGHVKEENGRYTITEDGREDVQKIAAFLPQVVGQFGTAGTSGVRTGAVGTSGRNY